MVIGHPFNLVLRNICVYSGTLADKTRHLIFHKPHVGIHILFGAQMPVAADTLVCAADYLPDGVGEIELPCLVETLVESPEHFIHIILRRKEIGECPVEHPLHGLDSFHSIIHPIRNHGREKRRGHHHHIEQVGPYHFLGCGDIAVQVLEK